MVAKDSFFRKTLFWAGVVGLGMSFAPLIRMANMVDPNILTRALLATTTTFGVVSIMSLRMPKTAMLRYGSILGAGLISLILLQLAGWGAHHFYGANQFSSMVHQVDLYGGIGLFSLFIAYDTHVAINMYEQGQPDHLGISLQLYLDFMNILRRLIIIMINRKSD